MPDNAKAEIFARVRSAIGSRTEQTPVDRHYRRVGTLPEPEKIAQFISRLEDYNAGVFRCEPGNLASTIASVAGSRGKRSLLIPALLPETWLAAGFVFVPDHRLSYTEMDQSEGVLTGCTVAVSFTGAIALSHSANEGRRALTLIPDYHLCVVFAGQLVETVAEGFDRLRETDGRPITTIAGPSATADIEMNRVKGVHGPRFLDVILIGGEG